MSYSLRVQTTTAIDLDSLDELLLEQANQIPNGAGTPHPEIVDHVLAASRAASALIATLGGAHDQITVLVSGHAEPDHAQRDGWAPEFCSVGVHVAAH